MSTIICMTVRCNKIRLHKIIKICSVLVDCWQKHCKSISRTSEYSHATTTLQSTRLLRQVTLHWKHNDINSSHIYQDCVHAVYVIGSMSIFRRSKIFREIVRGNKTDWSFTEFPEEHGRSTMYSLSRINCVRRVHIWTTMRAAAFRIQYCVMMVKVFIVTHWVRRVCRIVKAVLGVINEGSSEEKTRDIGGTGTLSGFTDAVIAKL